MLSVAQAQAVVLERAARLPFQQQALDHTALGMVLAEDVTSDLDMPPFDKSLMDGYAVQSADLATGQATLQVIDEVTAGQTPTRPVQAGTAIRIMTGAPLPAGADAVVVVEHSRLLDNCRIKVEEPRCQPEQNILRAGREMRRGDVVLRSGTTLRPQELGVLATVGRNQCLVYPAPTVAVLSTGDELIEPTGIPGPGQIRNGNSPLLQGQIARAGGMPRALGIARDSRDALTPLMQEGMRSSILVLSGGVSAGKLDLVPGVLQELGVEPRFHKIEMKPGKPLFFGTRRATLVFGLPGNPVSTLVCFELFVRPAIRKLRGDPQPAPRIVEATLSEDFAYKTDRPTYHPARLAPDKKGWIVAPVPWFGSSDLRSVLAANAFVVLPVGDLVHRAGSLFPVLLVE